MKMVHQYRRDWLECLVDAVMFVFDSVAKFLVRITHDGFSLLQRAIEVLRKDPKLVYAGLGGMAITYFGLGMIRCVGVLMSSGHPGISYMPIVDWWWVMFIKLLH